MPIQMLTEVDIDKLSYNALRKECKKVNLRANGKKEALRKSLLGWHSKVLDKLNHLGNTAEDFVCPITLEVPWKPVTAEDGRIYEEEAILTHIETHCGELKSPYTNEPMGERLVHAPQMIKNLIETFVKEGLLSEEKTRTWKEKSQEKKYREALLKRATSGDSVSMREVGHNHYWGMRGFRQDHSLAFSWYQEAHNAGDVTSASFLGQCLCDGVGVAKSCDEGMMYIGIAAATGQGCKYAAFLLGKAFAEEKWGMKFDADVATGWLRKALSDGGTNRLTKQNRERAQQMVNVINDGSNSLAEEVWSESSSRLTLSAFDGQNGGFVMPRPRNNQLRRRSRRGR